MKHLTLIHERVALCNEGKNPTAVCRLKSGWVVLGDDQRLRGYSLLLSDPVVDNLNTQSLSKRSQFLLDMSIVGDALMKVLDPTIINYSILGNADRALHAHIHPRYDSEDTDKKKTIPFIYHVLKMPHIPFDLERDKELISSLRQAIVDLDA